MKWITRGEFVHFRSTIDTSSSRTKRIQFIIFNTRFYRFSSDPQITHLFLGYAKISSTASLVGSGVLDEKSRQQVLKSIESFEQNSKILFLSAITNTIKNGSHG